MNFTGAIIVAGVVVVVVVVIVASAAEVAPRRLPTPVYSTTFADSSGNSHKHTLKITTMTLYVCCLIRVRIDGAVDD